MKTLLSEEGLRKLSFGSLACLALFIFTSLSLSALSHILILVPGLYFFYKSLRSETKFLSTEHILLGCFILWSIGSVVFNWGEMSRPHKNLFNIKYLLIGFLSVYAFNQLAERFLNADRVVKLLTFFLLSTSLATVNGIVAKYAGYSYLRGKAACHVYKACGMYGMALTYGYGIALFCALFLALYIYRHQINLNIKRWFFVSCLVINTVGLLLSYARGAVLGFVLGVLYLLWETYRKAFWGLLAAFIAALIGWYALFGTNNTGKQYSLYLLPLNTGSNHLRTSIWSAAWYAAKTNPIWGLGFRNYEDNSIRLQKEINIDTEWQFHGHAHNNILEMFADTGMVGGALFVLWLLFWFLHCLRRGVYGKLFIPFIITFVVSGLFQSTIIDGENMFFIMAVFALSQVKTPELA